MKPRRLFARGRRDRGPAPSAAEQLPLEPADAAGATTGGSLIASGLWNVASSVVPQLYTVVISVAAARYLGPALLGRQSFIAFVELTAIMIATGGLPMAVMRYIGERRGAGEAAQLRSLVAWSWRLEFAAAALGGGALALAAVLGAEPRGAWIFAGLGASFGVLHTVPSALLMGLQRWRAATIAGLVTGALATGGTVGALALGGRITAIFVVEAATAGINLAWTTWLARRALRSFPPQRAPLGLLKAEVLRYAGVSTLGLVLTFVVWRRSELFFLERFSTDAQLAFYSIAFSALTILIRASDAVATVAIPATATLTGAGEDARVREGYSRGMRMLLVLTLPLTAAALALGPAAVRTVYGQAYDETGTVLLVLLVPFPLVPLMNLSGAVSVGLGRLRLPLVSLAVGAALNLALDILLIPPYDAVGAALANSAAQAAAAVVLIGYAGRSVGRVEWQPRFLLGAVVAAAAGGIAAWGAVEVLGDIAGLIVGVAAAFGAYAGVAVLVHVLPPGDAAWIDANMGSRLGGRVGRAARLLAGSSPATEDFNG